MKRGAEPYSWGVWTYRDKVWRKGGMAPLSDRGFRYGMSVFESFPIRHGHVVFANEHLERLRRAAGAASFPVPDELGFPDPWPPEEGMGRLYVTAGDGSVLDPVQESRIFALAEETRFPTREDRECGFRVGLWRVPVSGALGGWKTGNYWQHVQALAAARAQGLNENLVLNASGGIVSAAMGNVFFWREGVWQTPALESGARDGVVRDWVLQRENVMESLILPEDLAFAEACVLTNSRLGVMPVTEIEGRLLPESDHARRLAMRYHDEIVPD